MALYLQETGSVTAPTIVFLHGGGGAGWMWQPQVEQLSDFHCLVPDLPEQGQSSAEKPFSISGSAGLIADLIRTHAHDGRAFVVGLSEGAQITVALLSQTPELVERAIVSSALVRSMPGARLLTPGLIRLSYRWSVTPFFLTEIERTALGMAMLGPGGMSPTDLIGFRRGGANIGIQQYIISIPNVHEIEPLEIIGREVDPRK